MTTSPLLDATGVAKNYGAVAALRNASLSVLPGEVHALMGANGAGKSTLVKILTGAVPADSGSILIRGQAHDIRSPAQARRAGLVSVYQEPALIPDLDVASNLRLTRTPVEPFRQWVRELGVPDLDIHETARDMPLAIQRVLDLARALAIEPDVLLLDEMTAALPSDLAEKVLDVVRRQAQAGRSVIFISHRFLEIAALCDRATVLRDGETVGVVDIEPGVEERIVELMLGSRDGKGARQHRNCRRRPAVRDDATDRRAQAACRREAAGRVVRPAQWRGAGHRRARGPGSGSAVRCAVGIDPSRQAASSRLTARRSNSRIRRTPWRQASPMCRGTGPMHC